MWKIILVTLLTLLARSSVSGRVHCPWSDDGTYLLVYNGIECVDPLSINREPVPQRTEQQMTDSLSFKCPETDGYFRSPENQTKYYLCQNGVPSLEVCPKNTVFDGKDACVDQQRRPFKCPRSKGKFRVTRSVNYDYPTGNQYYQCYRNRPRVRTCSQNQYFDGRGCVQRFRYQRQERFQCPADNGVYPDQRDPCCFWVCRDRAPTRGRCPTDQCGCVNNWHQVSGVIIHQDNGNQIVDTWNQNTGQWDRTYKYSDGQVVRQRVEQRYSEPRFVNPGEQYRTGEHGGIPGYPVDDAMVMAQRGLDDGQYY